MDEALDLSNALVELHAVCGSTPPTNIFKTTTELRQSIFERADRVRALLDDMHAKFSRIYSSLRQVVTKVVTVAHRCINAARRVRCARRPVAKKAAASGSSDSDGPAGHQVNFSQQRVTKQYSQHLSSAYLAHVVLDLGAV